jgi:hypothetical protein
MDVNKNFDSDQYKLGISKGFKIEQFGRNVSSDSFKNEPLFFRLGLEKGRKLFQEFKHLEAILKEHYNSNS